jgi:peptidoglycan/xylan/chitin deacetylase (PgdA/CDA1 family)
MTTYQWVRPLFWVLFLGLFGLWFTEHVPLWASIFLGLAYLIFLAWAAFHIEANFFTHSICKGVAGERAIALTFDDGPHPKHTQEVLDVLKKHDIKATFFVVGEKAHTHSDVIIEIDKAGHTLGGHSYTHAKWIDFSSAQQWESEIRKTQETLKAELGKSPRFFRPPYGVTTPHLHKALKRTKVLSIGWNARSLDTLKGDVNAIVNRVCKELEGGSIVLFHDNLEYSAEVLDAFLVRVQTLNLKVIPLEDLIEEDAYE